MTRRGDVVIARFPYAGGAGAKVRPAVVVQCDRLNNQIQNTLLAMITGNTSLAGREPTQFLIDPAGQVGKSAGGRLDRADSHPVAFKTSIFSQLNPRNSQAIQYLAHCVAHGLVRAYHANLGGRLAALVP